MTGRDHERPARSMPPPAPRPARSTGHAPALPIVSLRDLRRASIALAMLTRTQRTVLCLICLAETTNTTNVYPHFRQGGCIAPATCPCPCAKVTPE